MIYCTYTNHHCFVGDVNGRRMCLHKIQHDGMSNDNKYKETFNINLGLQFVPRGLKVSDNLKYNTTFES